MNDQVIYKEKQMFGRNMSSLLMRALLALFCVVLAVTTGNGFPGNNLLFIVAGIMILVSVALFFISHLTIMVTNKELVLSRTFRRSEVRVPVREIKDTVSERYSRYLINYPAFNLHTDDTVKFYTFGDRAVRLTFDDRDDHIIGTSDPESLIAALRQLNEG